MKAERVQKLLAQAGIASRRKCEELIMQGRVSVNGKTAQIGASAFPSDKIEVDGKLVPLEEKKYVLVNKPKDVVSTTSDPYGRKTVLDLVPFSERLYPVGRLDIDAEGLMLLTNDGAYANKMMHPRYEVQKTYEVWVNRRIEKDSMNSLRKGLKIDGRLVVPDKVQLVNPHVARVTLHEGQKHIVKRLFKKLGYSVSRLVRTRLGPWTIMGLAPGKYRPVTPIKS